MTLAKTHHIERYHETLSKKIGDMYSVCAKARNMMLDPSDEVEAAPAGDLAERVEGLVGPEGVAKRIVALRDSGVENVVPKLIDELLEKKTYASQREREADANQTVRTSLAVLTEGVVAAPIEGISEVYISKNPDGSEYLGIKFAGPIRSAGGTAQGLAVLVAEYVRRKLGLNEFRPTDSEIERYVEEIKLYDERVTRLQYKPSEDEVKDILRNLTVCVDGDPTEELEVAINRDLDRFPSNRIRGGMALVLAEGMAQKSRKIMKKAGEFGFDWGWLGNLKKTEVKEDGSAKPKAKFMNEVVGGRPIFSAPSAKGGFRIRYGHSRDNCIAAKSMHPATLILLDDFIATGTQVKVEKPGKGCIVTECDTIDGPIVRLKDGSVRRVESREDAYDVLEDVEQILFLGDILVSYGDYLQTNTRLSTPGYCEEWWRLEAPKSEPNPGPDEAVSQSLKFDEPLHPRYGYYFKDVPKKDLMTLARWLVKGKVSQGLVVGLEKESKDVLELTGVPHEVKGDDVVIHEYVPLLAQMGIDGSDMSAFEKAYGEVDDDASGYDVVEKASFVKTASKSGTYIGCRMGRPEKARERRMQPAVHGLFPIGFAGGRERSVNRAAEKNKIEVDLSQFVCPKCKKKSYMPFCPDCKTQGISVRRCQTCPYTGGEEICPNCDKPTKAYKREDFEIRSIWSNTVKKIGKSASVKGVVGMISESKIPEPLEKGMLRAINDVYVFKDGTIRFDATDAPLTHFRPNEVGLSVEKAMELGYELDFEGNPLTSGDQVLTLLPQDIIVAQYGGTYMVKVAKFVDQLMEKFYGMDALYRVQTKEDLIGELVVGLAPHTSAGVVGRIVGYTSANVIYAHPFWHAAKRRNADGDEDSIMLLADTLLNFSKSYLPEKRGGKMDAPLVVTTLMNPKEVDDEAHKVEIGRGYPLEFYKKALDNENPSSANVKVVDDILGDDPFTDIGFTHDTHDISGPVTASRYVTLKSMKEKINAQLHVAEKIRAIDEREVAQIVINSHFLRDTYGNLRAFSRQHFRCVKCNENYRRVPLVGKCKKCGGRLLLTVSQGNITKYLKMSMELAHKYGLSDYLKARLDLLEWDVESLTVNDLDKQVSLADFM